MTRYIIFLNSRFVHDQNRVIIDNWLNSPDYQIVMAEFAITDPRLIIIEKIPDKGGE